MTGVHAILLAAGAGRRFGGRKLLASWRSEPLVLASARIALSAPVDHCVAVVGCDADDVAASLRSLGSSRLEIVLAEDWTDGMSASLRRGIEALPAKSQGALIFLADMPLVPVHAAAPLLGLLAEGAIAAELRKGDDPAHPVAISRALFPQATRLSGDQGLRALFRRLPDVRQLATEDPGATFDVDRRSDLLMPARQAPPTGSDLSECSPGLRQP